MAFILVHVGESSVPLLNACRVIVWFEMEEAGFEGERMIGHVGFLRIRDIDS
jgi:hypothetical protein